jgi:hypothetical protein
MMTMRKIFIYLFLIILISVSANAQVATVKNTDATKNTDAKKNIDYASAFGISFGTDDNINGFKLNPNSEGNNFYKGNTHYNIGLSYGWMVTNKLRPRVELKYSKLSYGVGWANSNLPAITKSDVNLYDFGINLRADYMLLDANKFQMYVSPALKWEFNLRKEVHNTMNDGTDNWGNYNDVLNENPNNLIGGAVSAIFKYNIVKKVGITLTPEYTYFFRKFVTSNDKSYQRLSVNLGVEFNFY